MFFLKERAGEKLKSVLSNISLFEVEKLSDEKIVGLAAGMISVSGKGFETASKLLRKLDEIRRK
jgi:hypothetical protein